MSKKGALSKKRKYNISDEQINEYREVFNLLDKNKKGIISTNDIIKIKSIFSYPIGKKEIQEMIKKIDIYGEGKFDFKKFVTLMKKQIQFIDENDEDKIFKLYKEEFKKEFLTHKRKREKLIKDETPKSKNKLEISNLSCPIKKNEEFTESIIIEIEEDFDDKSGINFKKTRKIRKLEKNNNYESLRNINSKLTVQKFNTYDNHKEKKSYKNCLNNGKKKIKKIKENNNKRKKQNNKYNQLINIKNIDTIEIFKDFLPRELIIELENKNKENISLIRKEKKYNKYTFQRQISKYSSKLSPQYNYRRINKFNSRNNSISNKFNLGYSNKSLKTYYSSYCINSRLDLSPTINISNRKKSTINYSSSKLLKGIKEKLFSKGIDIKQNKKKNISFYKKNNTQTVNLQKLVNQNFYGSYNNKINNSKEIINDGSDIDDYFFNEIEMKEEKIINIKKVENLNLPKTPEENIGQNIQILNDFELKYRINRKKEKIIKNLLEIPHTIIIKKKNLNITQIKNLLKKKKLSLPDNKLRSVSIKEYDRIKNNNQINSKNIMDKNIKTYEKNNKNKILLEMPKFKIKEKAKKNNIKNEKVKQPKGKQKIKSGKYTNIKQRKLKDKEKKVKYEIEEESELSNISIEQSFCSSENESNTTIQNYRNDDSILEEIKITGEKNYSKQKNNKNKNQIVDDEDFNLCIKWS